MSTKIQWMDGSKLPANQMIIAAVPGVGNVGKLVIDTLNEQHESTMLARLIHPDLPPPFNLGRRPFGTASPFDSLGANERFQTDYHHYRKRATNDSPRST